MDCQEFEALSGAYALDAITDDERREANEHLAHCSKCQQTLRELQSVVNVLPLSVPPIEPPPHVKERLFATIHREASRTIAPLPQSRRSWWRRRDTRLLAALAALFCILFAVTLVWNLTLQQQIAFQQQTVSAPLTYTLHSVSGTTRVSGELIYFPQLQITTLVMHDLPALQGRQVYQGWLLEKKQPRSIGLLHVQGQTATLDFSGGVKGYDTVAVSIEPGPQASPIAPRGVVVAMGQLNHAQ